MASRTHGPSAFRIGDSFFRVIQGHLKDRFSGRLLALILCELGRQEPEAFLSFLAGGNPGFVPPPVARSILNRQVQFEREWPYKSRLSGSRRAADLAVLLDGSPIVLLEIKEDDVASPGNPAQLKDYLHYIETEPQPPSFVHLSRYTPISALPGLTEAARTGRVRDLRYRHLYTAMRKHMQDGPLARMVYEYLEDIGVNSYKSIDLDEDRIALTLLVTQMSGFSHRNSLGRLHSAANVLRGPELLKVLLGNAVSLGDWFAEENRSLLKQQPRSRFVVNRRYRPKLLTRAVASHGDSDNLMHPDPSAVGEGTLIVYASASLPSAPTEKGRWAYLELGFLVRVSSVEKERAQLALYGQITWSGGGEVYSEGEWLDAFPSEAEATAEMRSHLKNILRTGRNRASHPAALDDLRVPMART